MLCHGGKGKKKYNTSNFMQQKAFREAAFIKRFLMTVREANGKLNNSYFHRIFRELLT